MKTFLKLAAALLSKQAQEPLGGSPVQLASLVKRDYDHYAEVAKATGFTVEE